MNCVILSSWFLKMDKNITIGFWSPSTLAFRTQTSQSHTHADTVYITASLWRLTWLQIKPSVTKTFGNAYF